MSRLWNEACETVFLWNKVPLQDLSFITVPFIEKLWSFPTTPNKTLSSIYRHFFLLSSDFFNCFFVSPISLAICLKNKVLISSAISQISHIQAESTTCAFLFLSLSQYSDENMMDPYNLAICFGPTLMPIPDGQDPVACQAHVNEVIKTIIINHEVIFPNQRELDGPVYEKCMTGGEEYWWVVPLSGNKLKKIRVVFQFSYLSAKCIISVCAWK